MKPPGFNKVYFKRHNRCQRCC